MTIIQVYTFPCTQTDAVSPVSWVYCTHYYIHCSSPNSNYKQFNYSVSQISRSIIQVCYSTSNSTCICCSTCYNCRRSAERCHAWTQGKRFYVPTTLLAVHLVRILRRTTTKICRWKPSKECISASSTIPNRYSTTVVFIFH